MSGVNIPQNISCLGCNNKINFNWKYSTPVLNDADRDTFTSQNMSINDIRKFEWIDKTSGNVIEMDVVDYKAPLLSKWYYLLNDPRGRLKKGYWNFTYSKSNIIPAGWIKASEKADEQIALCGDGNEDNCTGWFYQTRYGQYYVLITFYQEADYISFENIVKSIISEFEAKIN